MLDKVRKSAKLLVFASVVLVVGGTIAIWIGWDFVRDTVDYVVNKFGQPIRT